MFAGWGSWVARFRWPVLSVALVAVIGAGIWGLGVFGQLTEGGYNDPNSESSQATEAVDKAFGAQGGDLVVVYTPVKGNVDDVELGKRIRAALAKLPRSEVKSSTSYWSTRSPQFVAKDKTSGIASVTLAGADDGAKLDAFREVKDDFAVSGATVQLSGGVVLADATSTRSTDDLARAEIISLPVVLILLLFLFGSLVAASLPVLVGGAAVLGSLGVLHAIAAVHEVNSFAVNVASLLGLGMAIDYGLFMVGRFREEQASGCTPAEAVRRTVATAGRTVVFSATLLMIALAGLLLFPQGFLKSLAYGGLAAVGLAALLSLTLLPALLAVLGPRVDKLPIRLPVRGPGTFWARLAGGVLRRPVVVVLPILAGLLVLAAPIGGVRFGEADERTLPPGDPARVAIETLKSDYPQFSGDTMPIVLRGADFDSSAFAVTLRQIDGIAQLSPAQHAGNVTVFTATLDSTDPFSSSARQVVDDIRSLPVPNGAELLVGGTTARNVDSLAATAAKLPWMVGLLVGATLILMFLAFGSILLPIKAVVMSALSLSATFGVLVWIFQDGHGASWLNVTPAPLEAGIVVLMAAVVFGLSTDYEVFLLSRMVEARAQGASTKEAVTVGLARTGRVISAAALLLIVVTGAFALSSVTTMRFVGVGMIVALFLDATVVRMLLVPAVLGLLGNAAWWAPGPLRRLQERAGLSEHAGEAQAALTSGRHAVGEQTVRLALPPGPSATKQKATWDREAAGILLLPPAMMSKVASSTGEAATEVIPKVVDGPSAGVVDDDVVDAEIIEDDPAPAEAADSAGSSDSGAEAGDDASSEEGAEHAAAGSVADDARAEAAPGEATAEDGVAGSAASPTSAADTAIKDDADEAEVVDAVADDAVTDPVSEGGTAEPATGSDAAESSATDAVGGSASEPSTPDALTSNTVSEPSRTDAAADSTATEPSEADAVADVVATEPSVADAGASGAADADAADAAAGDAAGRPVTEDAAVEPADEESTAESATPQVATEIAGETADVDAGRPAAGEAISDPRIVVDTAAVDSIAARILAADARAARMAADEAATAVTGPTSSSEATTAHEPATAAHTPDPSTAAHVTDPEAAAATDSATETSDHTAHATDLPVADADADSVADVAAGETATTRSDAGDSYAARITDNAAAAERITGSASAAERIADETPVAERIADDAPAGERIASDAPAAERIADDTTAAESIADDAPAAERISDNDPDSARTDAEDAAAAGRIAGDESAAERESDVARNDDFSYAARTSDDEPGAGRIGDDELVAGRVSPAEPDSHEVDEPVYAPAASRWPGVDDEPAVGELVDDDEPPLAAASLHYPVPYYPEPGVYRSESVSKYADYSAPDEFFFAPSSAGTFASSLELPAADAEPPVPYFGDRPDFERTRNLSLPDLNLGRRSDGPDLDATAVFEAPNRQAARAFESPDPETSGAIATPELDPVTPDYRAITPAAPAASTSTGSVPDTTTADTAATPETDAVPSAVDESDLAVTRNFDAPDLEATRRLRLPGLESTRRIPAPDVERARRLESSAPTASSAPTTSSTPTAEEVVSTPPLPRRPVEPTTDPAPASSSSRLSDLFPTRRTTEPDETPAQRRPTIFDEPAPVPADPGPAPYDRPMPSRDPFRRNLAGPGEPALKPADKPDKPVHEPADEPNRRRDPFRTRRPAALDEPSTATNESGSAPLLERRPAAFGEPGTESLPGTEPLPRRQPAESEQRRAAAFTEPTPGREPLPQRRPAEPDSRQQLPVRQVPEQRPAVEQHGLDPVLPVRRAAGYGDPHPQTEARPADQQPDPSPLLRPSMLGDQPYSVRPPEPTAARPPEPTAVRSPEPTAARSPEPTATTVPAPRRPADLGDHLRTTRPADLGDHLRESRPADLAQYTRRPTGERKPTDKRRPATLADQTPPSRRRTEDDEPAG
ncbi:MMPL family transporter [Actinoplanes bogorensis]|uniref:MMPL family transporter n=1 Tax=Paractinoplanes bogorensis TaxID=1610840 RepID=A0ABS5Z0L5_9ACTN|nr:MMPL family transporter [Actinoplanes bogorensis]MBU2669235.1 MMPL family transporter [Actinoplanes bogorensis]